MVDLKKYEFIHTRRDWSQLYKSRDWDCFLKIWSKDAIQHEHDLYTFLKDHNISVPLVLEFSLLEDGSYFLREQSLWDATYSKIVVSQLNDDFSVPNNLFDKILQFARKHLDAQMKIDDSFTISQNANISFTALLWEDIFDAKFLTEVQSKVLDVLKSVPKVWSHGDFNIHNILPNWIIDLEDSQFNFLGYDMISLLTHIYWFPLDQELWERYRKYTHSATQLQKWLEELSPSINFYDDEVFSALFLLRWAWAAQRMEKWPKLQKYRVDRFNKVGDIFLSWSDSKQFIFDTFNLR